MEHREFEQRGFYPEPEVPHPLGQWSWRDLREAGFGVQVWSGSWMIRSDFNADAYGGDWTVQFGPLVFQFMFNCGIHRGPEITKRVYGQMGDKGDE